MWSLLKAVGGYVALEVVWPTPLCTRTKVTLSLRSSPLVGVLLADATLLHYSSLFLIALFWLIPGNEY